MQGADGAQRLLPGTVELVLPEGNVVLEFGDFFLLVHDSKKSLRIVRRPSPRQSGVSWEFS